MIRRRLATVAAVLGVLAAPACNKTADKATADAIAAGAAGVGLPGAASPTTLDTKASQGRLAKAAAAVRCPLTGYAPPNDKIYADHGFADAAAFAGALDAAAKADPQWAHGVLSAVYAQACPGQRALPRPAPPTPTASEAAP